LESHEHKLIFNNLARTSLHLRLDHLQFLDWDVLPRRRAAMLAPRTVVTALMILNRMEEGRVSKEKLLPCGTRGPVVYGTADDGKTPLYAAARNGHLDVVTKLIAAGTDVNAACGIHVGAATAVPHSWSSYPPGIPNWLSIVVR
jgi:ankyrin repeat protein